MVRTRKQNKNAEKTVTGRTSALANDARPAATDGTATNPIVRLTSAASVQTDSEIGDQWGQNPVRDIGIRTAIQAGPSSVTSLSRSKTGDVLKLARDIIPIFDGTNMSINMFTEHCRAAAASVEDEHDMQLLIMLIKNKVTGQARRHIQDKVGATLEEILKSLQRAFASRADTSQLAQELAVIKREKVESIVDYGIRVSDILNKIIVKVMDKTPGARGLERCQEYKENAIKNFMRGLDRDTLYFVREKSPSTLDEAIEFAAEADVENITWNSVHGVRDDKSDSTSHNDKFVSRKRVATIQANIDSARFVQNRKERSLSSIQCFYCAEFGHFKRNCPKLNNTGGNSERKSASKKICAYCELDNHTIAQCRLKEKHDRERQNKKSRYATKKDLNSRQSRWNGARTTLNQGQRPANSSCLPLEAVESVEITQP
jgi:hypothetical protein